MVISPGTLARQRTDESVGETTERVASLHSEKRGEICKEIINRQSLVVARRRHENER